MLDFLGNFASVLISVVIVGGFLALAVLAVFELGAMLVFWIKHSLTGSSGGQGAIVPSRRRFKRHI